MAVHGSILVFGKDDDELITINSRVNVERKGVTFGNCLCNCISNEGLCLSYDALHGSSICLKKKDILSQMQGGSLYLDDELEQFSNFCWEQIFLKF